MSNYHRSMAHVETISSLSPIENADRIEIAHMDGNAWQVIVKKNEFNVGDKIVYIEIDAVLPAENSAFDFMADRKYRVRTIKLRGTLSQGLIMPISILPAGKIWKNGDDVTEILNIKKYDEYGDAAEKSSPDVNLARLRTAKPKLLRKKWIKRLMRYQWFRALIFKLFLPRKKKTAWPEFMPRTDECRCENCPEYLARPDIHWTTTLKIDGTSSSFAVQRNGKKWKTWVCSRNVVQDTPEKETFFNKAGEDGGNVYWDMEHQYQILAFLINYCVVNDYDWAYLQGETAGPNLQGNRYQLSTRQLFGFNLANSKDGRLQTLAAKEICEANGIPWVPVLATDYVLPSTIEEMKASAVIENPFPHDAQHRLAEGIVYRSENQSEVMSFKNVSNEYLLHWKI